jgi:thiaminase
VAGVTFLADLRQKLSGETQGVLTHPFCTEAEAGTLPIEKFRTWCEQQYPILNFDTRSIGVMLARADEIAEKRFFTSLLDGAKEAEERLEVLAAELGLPTERLAAASLFPRAQAYGHYLAWLALYGNAGEQTAAVTVNLPAYARVMSRLKKALETHYGVKRTDYLELWSLGLEYESDPLQEAPPDWEETAAAIVEPYVGRCAAKMERAARFLQSYERMFWDSVYEGA